MKFYFYLIFVFFFNCFAKGQAKYDTTYKNTYYEQKVSLFKLLPKTKNEIIFLGNSITDIGEWAEIWQNKNVKNRGISSDITFGVLARLGNVLLSKPAKLFVMIGINDIARNIPDSIILKNYQKIIDQIKKQSPKTVIYFQSILPTNNNFTEYKNHQNKNEHILFVNTALQMICAEEEIVYVDLHSEFIDTNGKLNSLYTNDGLHLNGAGYMKWKEILLEKKLM